MFLQAGTIQVPNDIYCLPRSLILTQTKADQNYQLVQNFENTKRNPDMWIDSIKSLCHEAGVDIERTGSCTNREVHMIQQQLLPKYQIVVYAKKPTQEKL